MFAMILERLPMEWSDLPAAGATWLQDAGVITIVAVMIAAVLRGFGFTGTSRGIDTLRHINTLRLALVMGIFVSGILAALGAILESLFGRFSGASVFVWLR